jgi:hypothetical protein
MSHHCGSCPNRRGGSTSPPPPLKPLICVSSQPAIQNHPPPPPTHHWTNHIGHQLKMVIGQACKIWATDSGFWYVLSIFKKNFLPVHILRIRYVYPGSDFFIPDPGSRVDKIPDSGSGSASKNTRFSKIRSGMFITDPGSLILDLDYFFTSRIPDPGARKAPDPGSGAATLVVTLVLCRIRKTGTPLGTNTNSFRQLLIGETINIDEALNLI